MYLKSIEVQGFKSFANKINFEFHNGITGIVGPNGSGKSNVADAVRWVLGEQKVKQLRGAKMEDVIFSGTETRRPLGFAYVAITLDNSDHQLAIDFDEVKVSRRIFRSGESEYMINGAVCRLKDVNELFYDTGIGKEGYSIIGQGQIEKILSGKPEDRRELFDEAAGIVKFKRRKAIAIKKLEEEKQNLLRVKDILSELENQIKPLEKQSEVAKKYLKLKEELKDFDINIFLSESKVMKDRIKELNQKYSIVSEDLNSTKESLANTKDEFAKVGLFIDELNLQIDNKKTLLNQTQLLKEKFEGEINVLNEQINSAKLNDTHIQEKIKTINDSIDSYNQELNDLIKNKQDLEEKLLQKLEEQKEEEEKLNEITRKINEITHEIEESKSDIIELLNEKSNIKAKIQRFDTMLEQIDLRKKELQDQLEKFSQDKEKQEQLQKDLANECLLVSQQLQETKNLLEDLTNQLNNLKTENGNLNRHYEDARGKYHREESKLESLRNLTERYEGYGNSIRKVMELKERKQGIIGVVADIIKVDKKYEVAIETCLGGNIQNIVTDNEKTAKDIIEYLKKNKFGRATFLPLNSISNKTGFNNEQVLSEKGVIGLACDLVNINKEYQAIAKYLLGRIVVADHIDNALALAKKYHYTLRIVTLDGEMLNAGGSLSGGAFKNSSNLLGRRREIEDIENSIQSLKSELADIQTKLSDNQQNVTKINQEIEDTKIILQEQILVQNTAEINLNQIAAKKQELINNFDSVNKESSEITEQIKEITINNEELLNHFKNIENKNQELERAITLKSSELEKLRESESFQSKANEEIRMAYANLIQQKSYGEENIKRITNELNKNKNELNAINSSQESAIQEIQDKVNAIEKVNESIQLSTEKILLLEQEINDSTKQKEEQAIEHKEFLEKRDTLSERINELDKELFRITSQIEKLEESYEVLANYIWNEYELTYNNALALRKDEELSLSHMKKCLETTKTEIRKLGDVNVNAIEEYKNVMERYGFLKTQHDDLSKAEESLIKIIDELDQGMRKQFAEKFAMIKKEFDKVFKELFGGGNGTIELVEEEDILDAGIRIIAQPPGKKLQSIMQLSGGEKSLTAIALLFSIQNLKPSPFCLLDEIEAALDDSNVIRFSDYLHKLTKFTQFIVITHRKGTMASADCLYGITMQEKGVSTLVSVNLLENQLEA